MSSNKLVTLFHRAISRWKITQAKRRVQKAYDAGMTILPFGPWALNLMMADTCNSRCIMCGKDYQGCGSGNKLTLDMIKTIYSNLPMDDVQEVIYGGGGEPFLNPELAAIAEYTRSISPYILHTVISNMIEAPEVTCRRLLEKRVHFLVSINAATRETFKNVAGINRFDRVMKNIRKLVRLRNEIGSTSGVNLSIVLMKQNMKEISTLVRIASEIGADSVKAFYARVYPEGIKRKKGAGAIIAPEDSTFYNQKESDSYLLAAEQCAKKLGIKFEHEPLFNESTARNRDCKEPWQSLFVNYNGNVYSCPGSEILFYEKIENGTYKSGNIIKQQLMEFWNNNFWQALRKTNIQKARTEIVPECDCCGNSIRWWGTRAEKAHVLDWLPAVKSDLEL